MIKNKPKDAQKILNYNFKTKDNSRSLKTKILYMNSYDEYIVNEDKKTIRIIIDEEKTYLEINKDYLKELSKKLKLKIDKPCNNYAPCDWQLFNIVNFFIKMGMETSSLNFTTHPQDECFINIHTNKTALILEMMGKENVIVSESGENNKMLDDKIKIYTGSIGFALRFKYDLIDLICKKLKIDNLKPKNIHKGRRVRKINNNIIQ